MAFAAGDHERHRLAAALGAHVDLGREAAATPTERLVLLSAHCSRRVLVRPDDGAVDEVRRPVDLARRVGHALQYRQQPGPDAARGPAPETAPDGTPGAEALRQITPGRTSAKDPQDRAHDGAVIAGRAAGPGPLGWKQRRESPPLRIGQFSSAARVDLPRCAARPPRRRGRARRAPVPAARAKR